MERLTVTQEAAGWFESRRSRQSSTRNHFALKTQYLDSFRYADLNEAALRRTHSRAADPTFKVI